MLICIWLVLLRLETARFINLLKVENEKECMALSSKEVEACLWYIRFQVWIYSCDVNIAFEMRSLN